VALAACVLPVRRAAQSILSRRRVTNKQRPVGFDACLQNRGFETFEISRLLFALKTKVESLQNQIRYVCKRVLMFLFYLFVAYVLLLIVMRVLERHMIFFPNYPGRLEGDWHPRPLNPEDVWLTASDGTKLHAWWISGPAAKFTLLAFHGNASNLANRSPTYEFLRGTPVNILALEYRGYGHSEGKPSEAGLYIDADAAYQFLVNTKRLAPKSIVSFGQSLGTVVATNLAAEHPVGGLVLEAPLPSASRAATKLFWFLPGLSLLVRSQFDTISKLRQVTAPILVVHCKLDPVLPFQFGQEVYNAAPSPKHFLEIDGECHEESSLIAPEPYRSTLREFLASLDQSE
jgi:fermentation-respiration switch protein FrsA (DUF1100 family)